MSIATWVAPKRPNTWAVVLGTALATAWSDVNAQLPDHPIITEVYTDPVGLTDGPVGRDPANLHQEFIEIFLPPPSALAPGINKDALRLTLYEVEGDHLRGSGGFGLG